MGRPCATVVLLDSSQENTNACCQNQEAIERHDALIYTISGERLVHSMLCVLPVRVSACPG